MKYLLWFHINIVYGWYGTFNINPPPPSAIQYFRTAVTLMYCNVQNLNMSNFGLSAFAIVCKSTLNYGIYVQRTFDSLLIITRYHSSGVIAVRQFGYQTV